MTIAVGTKGDGGKIVMVGLSELNVLNLRSGKPIPVDLLPLIGAGTGGNVTILIHYGETEERIVKELKAYGLIQERETPHESPGQP